MITNNMPHHGAPKRVDDKHATGHSGFRPHAQSTLSAWQPAELQRATVDANRERFADINAAITAGYRLHQRSQQDLADPSKTIFHLKGIGVKADRSVIDPNVPEHVVYRREPSGKFTLVGVMYETGKHDGSPVVGNLGSFHRHVGGKLIASEPGRGGMMHVWFSRGLADAYSPHTPPEIKRGAAPTMSAQAAAIGTAGSAAQAAPMTQPAHSMEPASMGLLPEGQQLAASEGASMLTANPYMQTAVNPYMPQVRESDSLLGWFRLHVMAPLFGW